MTVRRTKGTVSIAKPAMGFIAAGRHTSVADGGYVNLIRNRLVVESDHVFARMRVAASTTTLLTARVQKGTIRLEFSADPSTGYVVDYMVVREMGQTPQSDGAPVRTAGG